LTHRVALYENNPETELNLSPKIVIDPSKHLDEFYVTDIQLKQFGARELGYLFGNKSFSFSLNE